MALLGSPENQRGLIQRPAKGGTDEWNISVQIDHRDQKLYVEGWGRTVGFGISFQTVSPVPL